MANEGTVYVRYLIDDVGAAADFYVTHIGFELQSSTSGAVATTLERNYKPISKPRARRIPPPALSTTSSVARASGRRYTIANLAPELGFRGVLYISTTV
ncbi:MAG TPA: hypothetical protein VIL77_05790 [Gaiellaceae bacterium]